MWTSAPVQLRKRPSSVFGNTLTFREVCIEDAAFIVHLRTHSKRSRFISETSSDVGVQEKWLKANVEDGRDLYFIIEEDLEPVGSVRLYDFQHDSFCWGSWIILPGSPSHYSIESALIVYALALSLGFRQSHFDVRKENRSVLKFHKRFGAEVRFESDRDVYLKMPEEKIHAALKRYERFLPGGIKIQFPT